MAAADVDNADREQAYAELMLARSARELVDNASRDRHSIDDEWHVLGEDLDDLREKLDAVAQAATAAIVAHANHKEPARKPDIKYRPNGSVDVIDTVMHNPEILERAAADIVQSMVNVLEGARAVSPEERAVALGAWIIAGGGEPVYKLNGIGAVLLSDGRGIEARFDLPLDITVDETTTKRLSLLAHARAAAQIARRK